MSTTDSELPRGMRASRSARWIVLGVLLAGAGAAIGSLFMPDCRVIPQNQLPAFQSVMSLEERAARGEPFEKKGNRWYQCKTVLARAFFF